MQNSPEINMSIQRQVTSELIRFIYPSLWITLPSLAVVASMLVFKLQGHVNQVSLFCWLGVFLVLMAGQGALFSWYKKTKDEQKWDGLYFKLLLVDATLIGIMWGIAGILFMPADVLGQSCLVVLLFLVSAGGPAYLMGSNAASSLYSSCVLLPLIGSLIFSFSTGTHHEIYFNLIITLLGFWGLVLVVNYQGSKMLVKNVTLSLENNILTEDLAHANEIAEELNSKTRMQEEKEMLALPLSHEEVMHFNKLETVDALTGLDTEEVAEIKFIQTRAYAHRHFQNFAVMRIDITNYNAVKSLISADVADALLKTVAVRLQYCKRETDLLYRLTEGQFALVVSEVLLGTEMMVVVNKIFKLFAEKTIIEGHVMQIEANIGISTYPKDGSELHELIVHAENALKYMHETPTEGLHVQLYDSNTMGPKFIENLSN